jgi:hypothetical protein
MKSRLPASDILPSYSLLQNLLSSVRSVYNGTVLSYDLARKEFNRIVEIEKDHKRAKSPLYISDKDERTKVSNTLYELESKYKKSMPQAIRKVLYVQIVSILEAYLIEVTREIFINRRELFNDDGKIEFNLNEILASKSIASVWGKVINRKCRQLQNQGFNEVRRFFSKSFSIDFSQSPIPISRIEFLHDRRHLLVHRLGRIDKQFEHKYNFAGQEILLSEEEFYQALDDVISFSLFINRQAFGIINHNVKEESSAIKPNPILYIKLEWHSRKEPNFFRSDFNFISEESVHSVSEIMKSYSNMDNQIELELVGPINILRAYQKEIRKYENIGELTVVKQKIRFRALTTLGNDTIEKIIAEVPRKLSKFTHKEIALKLGLSERVVKSVIAYYLMTLKEKKLPHISKVSR